MKNLSIFLVAREMKINGNYLFIIISLAKSLKSEKTYLWIARKGAL